MENHLPWLMVKLKPLSDKVISSDLLWTAPELLRLDEGGLEQLSVADIASADLYSLGIILYEIYGRQGPYGDDLLDSNGSHLLVKQVISTCFRDPHSTEVPDARIVD